MEVTICEKCSKEFKKEFNHSYWCNYCMFEHVGQCILKFKKQYYTDGHCSLNDEEYDALERYYIRCAMELNKEPEIHMLCDWNNKEQGTLVGFPHNHPWVRSID